MSMHVDTAEMVTRPGPLREDLHDLGNELGLDVRVHFPTDREASRIEVVARNDPGIEAAVERLRRWGQPLEADVLFEAVELHLDDVVTVHHGRTRLRDGDGAYQLGLPASISEDLPDEPDDVARIASQSPD